MSYEDLLEGLEKRKTLNRSLIEKEQNMQMIAEAMRRMGFLQAETGSFFLSSPASLLRKEDITYLRKLPSLLETIQKQEGPRGYTPVKGKDYRDGIDGKMGANGRDGTGKRGSVGPVGPRGAPGRDGKDGQAGRDGKDGARGPEGPAALANTIEVRTIANQSIGVHEKQFDHALLHNPQMLGNLRLKEDEIVGGEYLAIDVEKKLIISRAAPYQQAPGYVPPYEIIWLTGVRSPIQAQIDALSAGASPTFVDKESPAGAINGINTVFTVAHTPTVGSDHVFMNGVLQEETTDYTISGATITFLRAPKTGYRLRVSYRYT